MAFDRRKEELARALVRDGAFLTRDMDHPLVVTRGKERGFKLESHSRKPDAPLSPYFNNIRISTNPSKPGTVTQNTVRLAAECMWHETIGLRYHRVCGVPNAGDPFAKEFSEMVKPEVPLLVLKKEQHGDTRMITGIEGQIPPENKIVLLLDDLITTARSKILAIQKLAEHHLFVNDVVVLIDRDEGGKEELLRRAPPVHLRSVFHIDDLLSFYLEEGVPTQSLYDDIRTYRGKH